MDAPVIKDVTWVFKSICPKRSFEYRMDRLLVALEWAFNNRMPVSEANIVDK